MYDTLKLILDWVGQDPDGNRGFVVFLIVMAIIGGGFGTVHALIEVLKSNNRNKGK